MALEDEAVRRAREGVRRPVRYKGKIVGYETDYSDQLLVFLLKNWAPDKYREQLGVKFEWDGDPAKLNPQQQERLMTYLASIAYPDDPAAAEIEKRKALGLPEGQVIDTTLAGESTASEVHGASGESRRSWGDIADPEERKRLAAPWLLSGPAMPQKMSREERVAWADSHWPLERTVGLSAV